MIINRKYIIFTIIALVFVGMFCRYMRRAPKRHYSDFRVYYKTGKTFAQREDIYSRPDMAIGPFKYSPMFAMLLFPLSLFSQKAASLIFFTGNFIALIFIVIFSRKLIVKDKISYRRGVFLYVASVLCTFRFILQVFDSGQVGIIILALVVGGLYFLNKNKNVFGAALIGLSAMFKYTSLIFLPFFFFKKKKKIVILIMIFILLYCLIPAVYVGVNTHIEYLKKWFPSITSTSLDKGSWYDYKNQSIYSLVLRFFSAASPYKISVANLTFDQSMAISFFLVTIIYSLIIFPKTKDGFYNPVEYSLLFICTALFNPNAWMHNFVIHIFVYMTLFYYLIRVNFKDKISLTGVVVSFVLMSLMSESIVGNSLENISEELSCVTIGTMILVFVLLRLKFMATEIFYGKR